MSLQVVERPQTFSEVIGNEATIQSLQQVLQKKDHPHCFMFHGISGSGKTTCIRIMAKMLGASDLDIHEYNIADTKGIDTARDIIEKTGMAPLGKATVIIMDESHKATGNFQEALLKPTEDVPDHVYFFLATTEPSKIIPTLKRRFTQYQFLPVDDTELFVYLFKIAKKHDIVISKKVLQLIVDMSHGSVAQGLNMLNKMQGISEEDQIEVLNAVSVEDADIIELCRGLLYKDSWSDMIPILASLHKDPESIRYTVLSYMNSVLLNPKSSKIHFKVAKIIDTFSTQFYTPAEVTCACFSIFL
jgi:DNA polymerase III subunit gamma/tau